MDTYSSIIEILYTAMRRIEATSDFQQGDPALLEVRKQVQEAILELWVTKASESQSVELDPKPDNEIAA